MDGTIRRPERKADLVQVLVDSGLFGSADRSNLEDLRPLLVWVVLRRGEVLPRGAAHSRDLYFVAEGRLDVSLTDADAGDASHAAGVVATMAPGDIVGEMQAFAGGQLVMTVRAATEVRLVKLVKEGFDHYLAIHPHIAERLTEAVTPRFYHRQMLMVVISGRLQVVAGTDGGRPTVREELARGEVAGVSAVLTQEAQAASVFAVRDSVLIEFRGTDFREMAERYPSLNKWLVRLLSQRLLGVTRPVPRDSPNTNIVLVPTRDGAPIPEMARGLCDALGAEAKCRLVSSTDADNVLGTTGIAMAPEGSPEDLRLQAWLDRLEGESEYAIYLADQELTNWTRHCIRQADEVIAVGAATGSARLSAAEEQVRLEQRSRRTRMRSALLLLHPHDTDMPRDTARWLAPRELDRHFHLREGLRGDVQRIARYVLQRELGLVLSGGGARGFAHIGVLRAIREADLTVDVLAGVSMGAIIAGRQAMAGDIEQMVPGLKQHMTRAFSDYTLPILALTRGRRFDRCLRELFRDVKIEDLWTPFFCLSSNLTRAATVVHRTGPMWCAIRASSGLPGLVPPVVEDGDLLYDGALMNNLPIAIMREETRHGPVIGVDVVPPVDLNLHAPPLQSPSGSGWRLALNRINPFGSSTGIPGIVSILQRAGQLPSLHTRRMQLATEIANLYIQPLVDQFKILDFSESETVVDIGYEYGVAAVGDWVRQQQESETKAR